MATHSSTLAWKIPRSLAGCSLWGHKESDTTEHASGRKDSRKRNVYIDNEHVKRINLSTTMEPGENTRGQNPHAIKIKHLSNRLSGSCSLKRLGERKTWGTTKTWEHSVTEEGKCPCAEKGTREQGPPAGKETKTAKMVRGPSTRRHELETASGDRPENRRGGTGSSQRIRGESLPVRPRADAWRGFLSHFPKPKSGSRQKEQALSRIWFSCSCSIASIYSRAWYAANAQNTVAEWKAIHVEKKRRLAALRNAMCLSCVLVASVVSNSFPPCELQPARLLCPWDSPGKNTGVGCHSLLQGIFPTQGLNPGSPELQADSSASEPWEKSMCLMASIIFFNISLFGCARS